MPRKILPNQIITYKKKIIYQEPQNLTQNFFNSFWGFLLIIAVNSLISAATGGLSSAILANFSLSQLNSVLLSSSFRISTSFAINTIFDSMKNQVNSTSVFFNLLASASGELGKIGRALKQDKILKIANQAHIFQKLNINQEINNFYQLQQKLTFQNIILSDKTILNFGKNITDAEILKSILAVSNAEMKKNLKNLAFEDLKNYIEMQRIIRTISPTFFPKVNFDPAKIDKILNKNLNLNFQEFLRLTDLEFLNASNLLLNAKLSSKTIFELNQARFASKFQDNFFQAFKRNAKFLKNTAKKMNPVFWINKITNDITKEVTQQIIDIKKVAFANFFPNFDKLAKAAILKFNLIPLQSQSFLLGVRFEPIGVDGTGLMTIFKKPYVWKKAIKISHYHPVKIISHVVELQEFLNAESHNQFYLDNFALGFGFRQQKLLDLKLFNPTYRKFISSIEKIERTINLLKNITLTSFLQTSKIAILKNLEKRGILILSAATMPIMSSFLIRSFKANKLDHKFLLKKVDKKLKNQTIKVVRKI